MLDGINQLNSSLHSLDWLPNTLPPNVTVIISSTKSSIIEDAMVRKRNVDTLRIAPLNERDRRELVIKCIALFGKSVDEEQVVCIYVLLFYFLFYLLCIVFLYIPSLGKARFAPIEHESSFLNDDFNVRYWPTERASKKD